MDHSKTDSTNGRDPVRQTTIAFTNAFVMILSFVAIFLFQTWVIEYALGERRLNAYLKTEWWLFFTLAAFLPFWYVVIFKKRTGWVNPNGNKVLPSLNNLYHGKVNGGGTKFIIYTGGFALAYFWEQFWPEQDIETEQEHSHKEDATVTIRGTGLKVKITLLWKPLLSNLSHYLQIGIDPTKREKVLNALLEKATSLTETVASSMRMSGTGERLDHEDVKDHQDIIAQHVKAYLQAGLATELGFDIADVTLKVDYSDKVQASFDQEVETQVPRRIARDIQEDMRLTGKPIDPMAAWQLALLACGKAGTSINRYVLDILAAPELSDAIKSMGPDIVETLKKMGPAFANLAAAVQRVNNNP